MAECPSASGWGCRHIVLSLKQQLWETGVMTAFECPRKFCRFQVNLKSHLFRVFYGIWIWFFSHLFSNVVFKKLEFISDISHVGFPAACQSLDSSQCVAYRHFHRLVQSHIHQLWNHSSSLKLPGFLLTRAAGCNTAAMLLPKKPQSEAKKKVWSQEFWKTTGK